MSRKGYPKARTGCITCKKRKIKCDETHPHCKRCTTTGRKCDGYAPLSHSYKYSWEQLLAPRMPLRIRNPDASSAYPVGRAMAYFHAKVAEAIFRPLGGDNWAHRLSRMAQSDPAVQHAALAIAALYEQRYEKPLETVQRPCENKLAIQHYNAAIRVLLALPQPYPLDNLLLVCALFVCIELLRDDPGTAINHIRYGTLILDSQPVDSELAPLFYHWNALPYVYGIGSTSFPLLQDPGYLIDASFKDLVQAQMIIDRLAVRILRLGSRVHHYRLSAAPDARVCTVLSSEQYQLQVALHVWLLSFLHFQQNSTISNEIKSRMLILEMQWLVWKIYTSSCLDLHETVYDLYMEYFQRIMQNATALAPGGVPVQSALDLGMGYFTSIFYVVVSCRHLKLRLTALRMLELSSQTKEQIWGVPIFQAIGKHLIEIEHCITLTKRAMEPLYWNNESLNFPVDTRRIRGYIVEPGDRQDSNGKHPDDKRQAPKYNVRFILRDVDNGITSEYTYQISVDRAC